MLSFVHRPALAQDTSAQSLAVIDEKLNRLQANVEALQFSQDKLQKQVSDLESQLLELRRNAGAGNGPSRGDLDTLEAKIKAVDEARQRDNKALVDQLAKELAAIGGTRSSGKTTVTTPATPDGNTHEVQKGETLATIAKKYGVSVADLAKANSLANPNDIKIGQKLTIPAKQ